jgi:hypothetical protein
MKQVALRLRDGRISVIDVPYGTLGLRCARAKPSRQRLGVQLWIDLQT